MCYLEKRMLPIGVESFEEIRTDEFYYVDKTLMIRDFIRRRGKVNLFTSPRRFGKSLNMAMLKCFFEINCDKSLFDGLVISEETELCKKYMGMFPVISISLKSVSGADYPTARALMCQAVGNEALKFYELLTSDRLTDREREMYDQLITVDKTGKGIYAMSDAVLMGSLKTLSALLEKHYGKKVIILIDEYDVPLAKANDQGYYEQMILLIRNIFEQALKTNESLRFAVLTGCMRITKESIFTGLNNLKILSVTDPRFDEYFGFTDSEVRELLDYYELSGHYGQIKEWYDGYRFGNAEVYCPWDVINYCDILRADLEAQPQNYLSNTSNNDVVRQFLQKADSGSAKKEIERLIAGEVITKEIHQELTYKDMYQSIENIWSVLLTTGYLTQRGKPDGMKLPLAIPNMEIRDIFITQIMSLFRESVQKDGEMLNRFCDALQSGNAEEVEKYFGEYLKRTISIRDTYVKKPMKENFYHGILLGILGFKTQWGISSNKESGDGYSDILIELEDMESGIVVELKYAEDGNLEAGCREALQQIERKRYEESLQKEGIGKILRYGIACYKKRCKVMLAKICEEYQ